MDYISYHDTIIFSPEFNKSLDSELLTNYKKIIFSNYELSNNLFGAYENNNFRNLKWFYCSKFNQSLVDSFNNLTSLTHLTFSNNFNQPLDNSFNKLISLTHLTFFGQLNQPLTNSLENLTSLTHLTFGLDFNQHLTNSLESLTSLTHLTLGYHFNQKK